MTKTIAADLGDKARLIPTDKRWALLHILFRERRVETEIEQGIREHMRRRTLTAGQANAAIDLLKEAPKK